MSVKTSSLSSLDQLAHTLYLTTTFGLELDQLKNKLNYPTFNPQNTFALLIDGKPEEGLQPDSIIELLAKNDMLEDFVEADVKKYFQNFIQQREFIQMILPSNFVATTKSQRKVKKLGKDTEFVIASIINTELRFRKELLNLQKQFTGSVKNLFDHLQDGNTVSLQAMYAVAMRAYKVKSSDIKYWLSQFRQGDKSGGDFEYEEFKKILVGNRKYVDPQLKVENHPVISHQHSQQFKTPEKTNQHANQSLYQSKGMSQLRLKSNQKQQSQDTVKFTVPMNGCLGSQVLMFEEIPTGSAEQPARRNVLH